MLSRDHTAFKQRTQIVGGYSVVVQYPLERSGPTGALGHSLDLGFDGSSIRLKARGGRGIDQDHSIE